MLLFYACFKNEDNRQLEMIRLVFIWIDRRDKTWILFKAASMYTVLFLIYARRGGGEFKIL